MNGYILDTSVLSALLDDKHGRHGEIESKVAGLDPGPPQFVSAISLGEKEFGLAHARIVLNARAPNLERALNEARRFRVLDVTRHTSRVYGELKSRMTAKYLAKSMRQQHPRWLEDWVDSATGKTLGVDENDLWQYAQAKERDMFFVVTDKGVQRIADADTGDHLRIL